MPPVLGPWSSSKTRLKSWAGARGTTVLPSHRQNSETSGPSRNSSTTTTAAVLGQARLARGPAPPSRSFGDDDALARGEPVVLDDVGRTQRVEGVGDLVEGGADAGQRGRHVGRCHDLLGEGLAALEPGGLGRRPEDQRSPPSRTTSATPATSGASGPITTRSTVCRLASSTIPSPSRTPPGSASQSAIASIPGLPGATITASTSGSAPRALTMACSRAPEPITRTFTGPA